MAQPRTADDELFTDREVRDSIMIIRRQRTTKLLVALVGLIVALGVLFTAVYIGFQRDYTAPPNPPAQPR